MEAGRGQSEVRHGEGGRGQSGVRHGEGGRGQSEDVTGREGGREVGASRRYIREIPGGGGVGWTRYGTCFVVQKDGDRQGVVV